MKKITIIVPLHEYNEKYLKRALDSIKIEDSFNEYYQILFIGPKTICKKAEKLAKQLLQFEIRVLENTETDFHTQVNKAVFDCVTPYFTILEYDDKFTEIYFSTIQKYIKKHPEYSTILTVNEFVNTKEELLSFANEIALDPSFANEIGVIGLEELEVFMDFNCTGGLFKTEDFISLGGLKKSLKIAAWYEYLMRSAYKNKNIHVIPKIGYVHTVDREDSYMSEIQKNISQEEGRFLIETARKEYFFKEDRNLSFDNTEDNTENTEK